MASQDFDGIEGSGVDDSSSLDSVFSFKMESHDLAGTDGPTVDPLAIVSSTISTESQDLAGTEGLGTGIDWMTSSILCVRIKFHPLAEIEGCGID